MSEWRAFGKLQKRWSEYLWYNDSKFIVSKKRTTKLEESIRQYFRSTTMPVNWHFCFISRMKKTFKTEEQQQLYCVQLKEKKIFNQWILSIWLYIHITIFKKNSKKFLKKKCFTVFLKNYEESSKSLRTNNGKTFIEPRHNSSETNFSIFFTSNNLFLNIYGNILK